MALYITPGRWRVQWLSRPPTVYAIDHAGKPHTIARLAWEEKAVHSQANGRLIAAAPLLYVTLFDLMRVLPLQVRDLPEYGRARIALDLAANGDKLYQTGRRSIV